MASSPTSDEGTIVVTDSGPGLLTQNIRAGHHDVTADEPAGVGQDEGPTPYDLLMASLGACMTMTVRMYADRKAWPLEQVTARLSHERTHADDCRDTSEGRCDRIDVELNLEGDLTDEQLDRLAAIAERCPVHRTLMGDIRIAVELT